MTKRAIWILLALALLCGGGEKARAGIIGELWQNASSAAGDATLAQASSLGRPADAMFNVSQFNFNPSDSYSVYTPATFLNNPTFYNTSGSFNPNGNLDNTYFYFTGSAYLQAGVNSFVVGHDDGLQLNFDGIGLVVNEPGPTALNETPFNVTAPTAGFYNFELSYGETAGPPASLVWTINGAPPVSSVPAPSGLVLGCIALFSVLGYLALQRRKLAFRPS